MRRYWIEDSAVREVVDDVSFLCEKLNRPICSKDLAAYYSEWSSERPELLQCWGQILIKATYPRKRQSPTLLRIGLIGYYAYYAPDLSARWLDAFRSHELLLRAAYQIKLSLPNTTTVLIGTSNEKFARNALCGFIQEYAPYLEDAGLTRWRRLSSLRRLLTIAERHAIPVYTQASPTDLIDRETAAEIIRQNYSLRKEGIDSSGHNVNRHLSVLKWPQSRLYPCECGDLAYSQLQVEHYCNARWPLTLDEKLESAAIWRCLSYGVACFRV